MSRAIQITPAFSTYTDSSVDGFRMTITATAAVSMSPKVFAYLAHPPLPGITDTVAEFSHVCSPADLVEFPEDAPAPNSVPAWFRTNRIDLVTRSRAQALENYNTIAAEVAALRDTLDRMDVLTALTPTWFGTPPP